jgi:DNA topoisomerase-2
MSSTTKSSKAVVVNASDLSNNNIADIYQKKTDKQHVLDNPDTYTGSMDKTEYDTYIYDEESSSIIRKSLTIIPGLYKLFDEGIVNCRDHQVRMDTKIANKSETGASETGASADAKPPIPVSQISISISEDGTITMSNDGNGIDVIEHPEHKLWIPEMIFAHLRTSTNYNKQEKKIVGGKNGFGVKLVFIWSSWGKIETVDHTRGLKYIQEFSDNLNVIHKPKITKSSVKPYTTITFKPDYKRLGIEALSPDMISLFKRRVYDIAAITSKKIKVKYNDVLVPVKNFQNYVDMYIGSKTKKDDKEQGKDAQPVVERIYEEANERWEYAVCLAPKEEFTQVSFVNGIFTGKGGKHVDYILNQIVRKITVYITKKKKVDVNPSTIKEQLMLFVRCDIDNPSFDSQTKDYMTSPISSFGSSCEVSEKFIEKLAKMGVMDAACALTEVKEIKAAKKTDGTKSKRIRGIPKLMDANFAGTENSHECSIILCEGDSAKAGIVSGLTKDDRNKIGVYPMRGKLFNVRGETKTRIFENKEINEIKQILGLETGKKYTQETAREKLRYGKVIFMTDQDLDGSHIKGLGINLFDSEWETLITIPGFIGFMNTPILKARKGAQELVFYNDGEYEAWKNQNGEAFVKGWKIKYYKGLGTSTGKEFKEYFENKKIVSFVSTGETTRDAIDMVFNKKRAPDRKTWLEAYDRKNFLDTGKEQVTYEDFISKEMIHFSKYDCERSIPNLMDGLKTSQRKIIFTAFKRNLTNEIKVAQFSGSVSELSCYHHGEQSINGAIVNMAQNFVGSNNINLLEPKGQFGTRLRGGEDSASERYIFTHLGKIVRSLFPQADDSILTYLDDDGTQVEPIYYAPIIPMILVNGSKGIGTGFSTDIMCYDPVTIIDELCVRLKSGQTDFSTIAPYYEGFNGTITALNDTKTKYLVKGSYEVISAKQVRITELPVGTWTDDYKEYLEDLISGDKDKKKECVVRDYNDMSTDKVVDITVTFAVGAIEKLTQDTKGVEQGCNGLEKLLKLYTTRTTTNMHMFDENEKLCHFKSVAEVIEHFMGVRLEGYVKRKASQIKQLTREMEVLKNKARFITEVLNSTIDMRGKKREQVSEMLSNAKYDKLDEDDDYKYLVKMPMDMVTAENVDQLNAEKNKKIAELNALQSTSEKQIWISELEELKTQYMEYRKERNSCGVVAKKVVKKLKVVSSSKSSASEKA